MYTVFRLPDDWDYESEPELRQENIFGTASSWEGATKVKADLYRKMWDLVCDVCGCGGRDQHEILYLRGEQCVSFACLEWRKGTDEEIVEEFEYQAKGADEDMDILHVQGADE